MNHGEDGDDPFDIFDAEEDAGEFRPCMFSDDEDDDDSSHGELCSCPLCVHGDGGNNSEQHHVLMICWVAAQPTRIITMRIRVGCCLPETLLCR